jgi:formate dehydrogenase iron-sulfur subunit
MINDHKRKPLTRRDMLKLAGLGASGLLLRPDSACAWGEAGAGNTAAMLYDATRCEGCRVCEAACKESNNLPPEPEHPSGLTARTWTIIQLYKGEEGCSFVKRQCMHCEHPACVAACPVGALEKTADGPVIYHDNKCIGCRYCMMACPFGVPTFDWFEPVPYIRKGSFCTDRLAVGLEPACVAACPTGALKFGERDELIAEARERIAAQSGKYVDHIYGEDEVGGTSWLYLSSVPFDKLGLPTVGTDAVTANSEIAVLAVPPVLVAVATAMSGLYWFTKRRDEANQAEAGAQKK